ncbi:importin [Thraustotheca clavata]|uniref:Importin n=1 Tax=Thraustotheca clavata TaxID=74557 RepID=A0A1V9ZW21_9STRA|nr:importin [Thraustotheca clavata]
MVTRMEELGRLLEDSLAADAGRRQAAEAALTQSFNVPGFALLLTQSLEVPMPLPLAHMASLLLKKCVIAHWETDEAYCINENEKAQIRAALVHGLKSQLLGQSPAHTNDSKFQTAMCLVLTEVVKHDWPEKWPDLFPVVLEMLSSTTNPSHVQFAIKFFSLVLDHIASEHFVALVPLLFPHLERISMMETASVRLHARVITIVQTCLTMVGVLAHSGDTAAGTLLHANITNWISRFIALLTPAHEALHLYVLRALSAFVTEWPKDMSSIIPDIVPPVRTIHLVWQLLVLGVPSYEQHVVLASDTADAEGYDSDDGAAIGQAATVVQLFEFVRALVQAPTKKTRQLVTSALSPLILHMVSYMQITQTQMDMWGDDPNKYIADEDDESMEYNVRNSGIDLLQELETSLGSVMVSAAVNAAQQRLCDSSSSWRIQEAALLIIGTLSKQLVTKNPKKAVEFDVQSFLQILFNVLQAPDSNMYLKARALWCASRFAKVMNEAQLTAFLQVAVTGLDVNQVIPVKLYACRAIGLLLFHDQADTLVQPMAANIIERLINLCMNASTETVHVVLETMASVVHAVEAQDIASVVVPFVQYVLGLWHSRVDDRMVHDITISILAAILAFEEPKTTQLVAENVINKWLLLLETLHVSQAMELLEMVLKHALPHSTPELRGQIVTAVLDPLLNILLVTDDGSVLQSGGNCIKWCVMHAAVTVQNTPLKLPRTTGMSGVDGVMQVAAKLLSPTVSDSGAMTVGGLVSQVLLHLSNVLPVQTVQSLLHAVSIRLAQAELPSLIQSLCMVYARLIHSHGAQVILDALAALPGANNQGTMLEFVCSTWVQHQTEFYGNYSIKVTVLALLQIVQANDARVSALLVQEDPVVDISEKRTTRSQKKTREFTKIPFSTKVLGILAQTYVQVAMDDGGDELGELDGAEWSDSEDDDEDVCVAILDELYNQAQVTSTFAPSDKYQLLSEMLEDNGGFAEEADDLDDEALEAAMDPLNEIDLKNHITQVVKTYSTAPNFTSIASTLSATEQDILKDIIRA